MFIFPVDFLLKFVKAMLEIFLIISFPSHKKPLPNQDKDGETENCLKELSDMNVFSAHQLLMQKYK